MVDPNPNPNPSPSPDPNPNPNPHPHPHPNPNPNPNPKPNPYQVGGSSWSMRRQCVSVTDTLSPDISISLDCSSGSELEHAVGGFGRSFRRRDALTLTFDRNL